MWNILNFRMGLINTLQAAGHSVVVAAPPAPEIACLPALGIDFHPMEMSASGTSPLQEAALCTRYFRLMRRIKPVAYLGFTPKPNVYGSLAARMCGVPTINNITGLGTAFIHGSMLEKLLSGLYRLALSRSRAVFFHNPDDQQLFVERDLVESSRTHVIPGSGIDLARFAPAPLPTHPGGEGPAFLFVGRLLWEKGVGEFAAAATIVKRNYPKVQFRVLGGYADGGRAVPKQQVEQWQTQGSIDYLGTCDDVREHVTAADCVVLPSYREGLPRVLLEAAAMARPAIATDVPGCRQAVSDGSTGFLCEARSAEALAEAIERMIKLSADERHAMGQRARELAEERFGVERVSTAYLSVLERLNCVA